MLSDSAPQPFTLLFKQDVLGTQSQDAAVHDGGVGRAGGAALGAACLDGAHDAVRLRVARNDLAKDDVLSIEPAGDGGGDEELGAIGVWSRIGHGQKEWAVVLQLEVLVGELLSVDGATASAIVAREVTALEHEVGNDTVESAVLVVLSIGCALADFGKVLGSLGDSLIEEDEIDASGAIFILASFIDEVATLVNLDVFAEPLAIKVALRTGHG